MARTILFSLAAIALTCAVTLGQTVVDVRGLLTGYEEVPSISTEANGQFIARIARDNRAIEWELSYSNLEGVVQQAHIHFGNTSVNGGIVVFLCTNLAPGQIATGSVQPLTPTGTVLPLTPTGTVLPLTPTGNVLPLTPSGPIGTQPCPLPPAVISGRIFAADVNPTQAARTQGIEPGEIEELSKAMRAGATYADVHTTLWPNGEIRSQILRATP